MPHSRARETPTATSSSVLTTTGTVTFDDPHTDASSSSSSSETEESMPIVRLSPALKSLVKRGNYSPPAGPSAESLNRVFNETLGELNSSSNGTGLLSWLVITTATLLTKNAPPTMGHLYRFAVSQKEVQGKTASARERAERVALMREAGLKCAVLVGIPRTINSLGALREATEDDVRAELDTLDLPRRSGYSKEAVISRGQTLFKSIYDPHTDKLLHKLGQSHPDFPDFIIEHAYGGVLSNPPASQPPLVSRTMTSALAAACLRAQGHVGPQLTSHVFGLLKAKEECEGTQTPAEEWISTEAGAGWVLETVDRLCHVVDSANETEASRL